MTIYAIHSHSNIIQIIVIYYKVTAYLCLNNYLGGRYCFTLQLYLMYRHSIESHDTPGHWRPLPAGYYNRRREA